MNLQELKLSPFERTAQAIVFNLEGKVLETDNSLFELEIDQTNVFTDTYFFTGLDNDLQKLLEGEALNFNCVGLNLFGHESFFDFKIKKVCDEGIDKFCWLIYDFGDQYRKVLDIQQERNLQAIESKKLEREHKKIKEEKEAIERLYAELHGSSANEYVLLKSNNQLVNVGYSDILYFEAFGDYVKVHTEERVYIVYMRMKEVEEKVPVGKFFRTHRSFLVQMNKIRNIEQLSLSIGEKILPIGKNNKQDLLFKMSQF